MCLKGSEENLEMMADLNDYYLQFKKNNADFYDFMQVPPYGAFETKSKNELFKRLVSNKEDDELFKKYD